MDSNFKQVCIRITYIDKDIGIELCIVKPICKEMNLECNIDTENYLHMFSF